MFLDVIPISISAVNKFLLSRRFGQSGFDPFQLVRRATFTRSVRFIQCVKRRYIKVSQAPCLFTTLVWQNHSAAQRSNRCVGFSHLMPFHLKRFSAEQ